MGGRGGVRRLDQGCRRPHSMPYRIVAGRAVVSWGGFQKEDLCVWGAVRCQRTRLLNVCARCDDDDMLMIIMMARRDGDCWVA